KQHQQRCAHACRVHLGWARELDMYVLAELRILRRDSLSNYIQLLAGFRPADARMYASHNELRFRSAIHLVIGVMMNRQPYVHLAERKGEILGKHSYHAE